MRTLPVIVRWEIAVGIGYEKTAQPDDPIQWQVAGGAIGIAGGDRKHGKGIGDFDVVCQYPDTWLE